MFGLPFIFGNFKWQIIAGVAILAILGSLYFYWNYSQDKIASLTAKNVVLQSVVDTQTQTIATLRTSFADSQKKLDVLASKYATLDNQAMAARKASQLPIITKTNKKQVETTVNASINTVFSDINTGTQIETF